MTRPNFEWQRGLQHFNGVLFLPSTGTDGAGKGLGTSWTTGVGLVSHPAPGTAFDTQFKRTKYSQVVTTTNQELGPRLSTTGDYQFWLGNADNLGGWYFSAIFRLDTWTADTGRLFVGLSESANAVCISDTVPNNTLGLWHKSTDGQDVLKIMAKDNAGTETTADVTTHVANPGILASGQMFLWEMWAYPNTTNDINPNYRLSAVDTTDKRFEKVIWNSTGGLTSSTAKFMAPQCQISNGTADTTANHYEISVANIYVNPYSDEQD